MRRPQGETLFPNANSESWGSSRPPGPSARSSATSASRWPTARAASATRSLVEGLLAPAFGIEVLDDAAAVGELALTTDAFVVKPLRFPGGSIGELAVNGTVNDLAMGGAKPLALTVSLILEEGLDAATLRAEVDAIVARGRGGRRRDRRRRHQGRRARPRRRHVHHDDRPRPARPARGVRARAPGRPDPALRPDRRARHRDHAGPRRVRPRLRRHRLRHAPAVARGRRDPRAGRPPVARRHPRRRRLGAERARARLGRRDADPGGGRAGRARGRRRLRAARDRPDVRRQRGRLRRDRRPGAPGFADIGEVKTEPPGMVLCRRASAASG